MESLSIVIPVGKEPYLNKTIESLISSCVEDIEIIPVFDGYDQREPLPNDSRIKPIKTEHKGMRNAINTGVNASKGKYLMKCDAHCCFAHGFDKILIESCQDDWLVIPRRYSLIEETWDRKEFGKIRDYHYITFPHKTSWGYGIFPIEWFIKGLEDKEIDDTMTFQGSCWLSNREYFTKHIGLLDDKCYSPYGGEQLEIGLKYWLGGGRVIVNKRTWYAHLRKTMHHYNIHMFSTQHKRDSNALAGHEQMARHWLNNQEPNMIHDFKWLIEKFWPVPTWPEDRSLWVYPEYVGK